MGLAPGVEWSEAPEDCERLAIVFTELRERPARSEDAGRILWAAYNVPVSQRRLDEGAVAVDRNGAFANARNEVTGEKAYAPPSRAGRYRLEVFAQQESLPVDLYAKQVLRRVRGRPSHAVECTYRPSAASETSLLFAKHRVIAWLFAWWPRTFATLFVATLVLLILPAFLLGIHSVPPSSHNVLNSGFWVEFNWGPLYLIVIPTFFAGASVFGARLRRALMLLSGPQLSVFRRQDDRDIPALDLVKRLRDELAAPRLRRLTFWICAAISIALTVIDVRGLFRDYVACIWGNHCAFAGQYHDWSITRALAGDPGRNLAFVIVAYAYEGVASFLFLFVATKFFQALSRLRRHVFSARGDYFFHPLAGDERRRLGLGPLGRAYNAYLAMVCAFYLYVALHRAQLMMRDERISILDFARKCIHPPVPDLGSGMQVGMVLLLVVGVPLAIGVIVYFPLFTLKRYIAAKREEVMSECADKMRQEEEELTTIDPEGERAKELERSIKKLREKSAQLGASEIWPNGNRVATTSLIFCGGLVLAAIHPYALAYVLVSSSFIGTVGPWLWGVTFGQKPKAD